jgi:hypothetical protein
VPTKPSSPVWDRPGRVSLDGLSILRNSLDSENTEIRGCLLERTSRSHTGVLGKRLTNYNGAELAPLL